ncbi:uncharacterized protein [Hemitrygon akajei]|uniref:uncharacterized protein isoform X2 n=1 Tax=Hemitrygon akajei TaxID=2704970 RepID=UPI003BF9D232
MDRSESYMTVNMGRNDSRSPSRGEPDVSYAEVNFKRFSAPRVRADRDCLNSTYSELNFRKEEPRIDEHEDPPIASGSSGLSATAQTAAQGRESKVKIGNRPYRLICLLCLVTFALIVIVAGLSIHVSQIRHKFTEMETKYRSVNETKAQICELLTSRRGLRAGVSCTRGPLERSSAVSAEGVTLVIMIGVSSARSRHLCSRIFLKRSRVSVNSQWSRHESRRPHRRLLPRQRDLPTTVLSLTGEDRRAKCPVHPIGCFPPESLFELLSETYKA